MFKFMALVVLHLGEGEVQSGNVYNENTWNCMQAVSLGILMFSGGGVVVDALRTSL